MGRRRCWMRRGLLSRPTWRDAPLLVVRDPKAPWRDDVFFQISETETGRGVRTKRWKYAVTAPYDDAQAASATYREAFLYDLENDPYESISPACRRFARLPTRCRRDC